MSFEHKHLRELFEIVDSIGGKRYHKLSEQDFENYKQFDHWRYINGDYDCGTTQESKDWVNEHSDTNCPICGERYFKREGKTIDHKLPRSQYPWWSMEFKNLWVICRLCNLEKGEMHWYEYEHYVFVHYPSRYSDVRNARPKQLLRSLSLTPRME
jgi:hypothetical protein